MPIQLIQRKPAIDLYDTLSSSVKELERYFKCPICKCTLTDTHGNLEQSQHRICGRCVKSNLNEFNKGCPSCSDRIVTCSGFRQDKQFEELKNAVFSIISFIDNESDEVISEYNTGKVVTPAKGKDSSQTTADMPSLLSYPIEEVKSQSIESNEQHSSSNKCDRCIIISSLKRKRDSDLISEGEARSSIRMTNIYSEEVDLTCIAAASRINALKHSPIQDSPRTMTRSETPQLQAASLITSKNVTSQDQSCTPYTALLKTEAQPVLKSKKKGKWTKEEDAIVTEAVITSNEQPFTRWSDVAEKLPGRARKQIRDRWVNYLNPNINHAPFTREDDLRLWSGYQKIGKKWAEIGAKVFLMTRPENTIKNRWNSVAFKKFIESEFGEDAIKKMKEDEKPSVDR